MKFDGRLGSHLLFHDVRTWPTIRRSECFFCSLSKLRQQGNASALQWTGRFFSRHFCAAEDQNITLSGNVGPWVFPPRILPPL